MESFEEGFFVFPASFAQQRLWFLDQLMPGNSFYNMPVVLRLQGQLHVSALEECLLEVVHRHEVLRTTFLMEDEQLMQVIHVTPDFSLQMSDLRGLPASEREEQANQLAREEAMRPFDLAQGPLMRASLLQLDNEEYLLLLTMHHIISDGWSMGVLVREVAVLYEAFAAGKSSPLAELPIQYADFADWQREWMQGAALEQQLAYWRKQLAGTLPVLQLPSDRPRPASQTFRGATHRFTLSKELTRALLELSGREGATLFMTLLAAYQTLLYRYTGQEDITVGSPIANRNMAEIEELIGFFVNTLVLRTDMTDASFRDLLARVRQAAVDAYANQDVPFEKLVEELQPERNLSYSPLFQVMFVLQNTPMSTLTLPGLMLQMLELDSSTAKFDLTLTMMETPDGLAGQMQYNSDLFDQATIERMTEHFATLLQSIVGNPDQSISKLPMLSQQERNQLLTEWNATKKQAVVPAQCVHQLFEEQVERTPDAIAVVFEGEQLTYRELNRRANRLAHHLRKMGIGADMMVGLYMERCLEMVVGVLGILKAGGAYLPLDPKFPQDRLAFMLEDAAAPLLLTLERLATSLPEHPAQVICLDAIRDLLEGESDENPANASTSADAMYVIYTSGSTGKPKGVLIEHRQLVNYLYGIMDRLPYGAGTRYAWLQPLAVDASKTLFYLSLTTGGCLHVISEDRALDAYALAAYMEQEGIDWLKLAPSHLAALQSVERPERLMPRQVLMLGGEGSRFEWVRQLQAYAPDCLIVNHYGPTETTVGVLTWQLEQASEGGYAVTPLGRPLANAEIYLLDGHMQPVPTGVAGELYIGGDFVAREYLNRPDLTAERFLPNPFSSEAGARFYKSGDVARFLPDGTVEFLGRTDDQVKIRGFRIELGEIQAVLAQHAGVREALIMAREDSSGEKRLVAYVVPEQPVLEQESESASISEWRVFVKERLPEHMVPAAFLVLESLPRTRHGKVDRQALPVPEQFETVRNVEYVAPRTAVEEIIAQTFANVLRTEQVGVLDNFFERGGHSLLATQVISRLNLAFAAEIPLRRLFEAPTVAELALVIERTRQGEGHSVEPIMPVAREAHMPLSFAQERLWFIDQWSPNSTAYHMPAAVRLTGRLDVSALERAFQEIVRRHEALRTTFLTAEGQPVQVIHAGVSLSMPLVDLSGWSESERENQVLQAMRAETQNPFDLTQGPLLRTKLLQLSDREYVLLLTMHHIVSDGWSMGVFVQEVAALYEAFATGQASPLPELVIQYADYAQWQRQWMQGNVFDGQLAYWKKQLGGSLPVLQLPTDFPRPALQTSRGASLQVHVPKELAEQLKELSRRVGATLFMTLVTAYKALLHRYTGQDDILVGTPIAGRTRTELEGLIGFFVNTLVLRTEVRGEMSVRELLACVRDVSLEAYAHQDLPFEKLVKELQPERDLSYSPLFQVLFVLQNTPREAVELSDLTLRMMEMESDTTKFDLSLSITDAEEGLLCRFEYNADLFTADTVGRMASQYQNLLAAISGDLDLPISKLPLLREAERQQLLAQWQGQAVEMDQAGSEPFSIHQSFETQAARTPDRIAVVFEDQHLTYRELNERANQLAHHLQRHGVGPEVLVGLLLERSLDAVVGILGVLKAGGAYVPLDPMYPQERIAFVLQDAGVQVLVTQEALLAGVAEHQAQVICLDTDGTRIAEESMDNPLHSVRPDQLAYVIYTSGSTGQPKGALIPHANVGRLFSQTQHWYQFDEEDVWTLFHSCAFDFSVWEIFGALLYGGKLVVVPYGISRTPEAFYELLVQERVTVLNQTPSAFRHLMGVDAVKGETADLALRYVIFGGEALELQSLRPWFERHGDQEPQLVNMYGITETTVHVTYRPLSMQDLNNRSGSVIGIPIPDLQVYVLDQQLQPVPIGVPGEMYVGGAGVARGYLNRPELSAERFITNPFTGKSDDRLYKTGDLARYLATGELEYRGRIDHQVKVRGFRIELGEIESVLMQHPQVQAAVVVAREDDSGNKRLVGYFVADEEFEGISSEVRRFLQEKLPEYMVPSVLMTIEHLPLTHNGKVDVKALPSPDQARSEHERVYVAPRTTEEEMLADIWADVLQRERVGIEDNFFELGGDSILSIQVLAKAKQQGVQMTLQDLFRWQTVRELAQQVSQTAGLINQTEPIEPSEPFALVAKEDRLRLATDLEDAYPLTKLQAGMLFHSQFETDSTAYHNVSSFRLRTPYDGTAFQTAIRQLIAHHPILRTSFDLTSYSEPLQLVHRESSVSIQMEDLRDLSSMEQEAVLDAWFEAEKRTHFDFTQAPLMRFHIHRLTDEVCQFGLSEHHAILDGWSVASLLTELFQRYLAIVKQEPLAQAEVPSVKFGDFVRLERQALASDEHRRYWHDLLSDHTFTQIARWDAQPQEMAGQNGTKPVPLSSNLSQGLKQVAQMAKVPLKSVLLAAHLRVIGLLCGQADVLTGLVSNGRSEETDGEKALGLFLNTVPLRLKLTSGTWLDLVQETFQQEQAMLPYRRYPLMQMQQDHGGQALFEVAFNFTHFHVYQALSGVADIELLDSRGISDTNFALGVEFSLDVISSEVRLQLRWDAGQFSSEQMQRIAGYYVKTLEAIANSPTERYETGSLLSYQEQQQLLREWSAEPDTLDAEGISDRSLCAHQLFERCVERTPDAIAVVFEGERLTYRELDERANQLAHLLQKRGVGKDVLVGICMERSLEMIVGILGVLKAGGAYVPLDPSYPADRLAYLMQDSGVPILLTQERLLTKLPEQQASVICLDRDWHVVAEESAEPCSNSVSPEQLAYVIYTSGSTGQPKGVMLEHKGLVNLTLAKIQAFHVDANSRVLQSVSFSFDVSVSEIFLALSAGATLYLARQEVLLPGPQLIALLREEQITIVMWTPAMLTALVDAVDELPDLRTVFCGGESCPPDLIARWSVGRKLINAYGPTETTVMATYEVFKSGSVPTKIGRPIPGVQIYVLDAHRQPVPVGVPGELYIGGVGVARGYLNRPELTAEKFIPHPFAAESKARLYRTGDLVRFWPDGSLEFLGRIDQQVKIRGFRIELGEIESKLAEHPAVAEAVVIVRADDRQDKQLVAYWISSQQPSLSVHDLRKHLQERLPAFMMPAAFVELDQLPLTPNGKVDRQRLPVPEAMLDAREAEYVAPRDRLEWEVAQMWEEVLGVPRIGVRDDFFNLGGHSLSAVRLIAKLQKQFGCHLPLSTLFQNGTVEQLAGAIRRQESQQKHSPLVEIQSGSDRPPFFCVHPVGGSVLAYVELARAMGAGQPFYGLQAPGLEAGQEPLSSVPELAACYLEAIRSVQQTGPYYLGGWSFGGVVAFEMAQQLKQQGEEVALLAMFDSRSPQVLAAEDMMDESQFLAAFVTDLAGGATAGLVVPEQTLLEAEPLFARLYEQAVEQQLLPPDLDEAQFRRLYRVFRANYLAAHRYVPAAYSQEITFFEASGRTGAEDLASGWLPLAPAGIELFTVASDHFTIMKSPYVQLLAERLSDSMNKLRSQTSIL